jgi:hypothetical protein
VTVTAALKQELWRRFGTAAHPAEWNGLLYGGGKISQRFWEYFIGVELLGLDEQSVVLDIGGGSPVTGYAFFAELVAPFVRKVVLLDPQLDGNPRASNITFVRRPASYAEIGSVLAAHPDVTHVCSLSVFEHIEPAVRRDIVRGVNDHFTGETFVATLEYHSTRVFFEQQLTTRTLSELFTPFTNFYLDRITASPVWAENAYAEEGRPALRPLRRVIGKIIGETAPAPRWYPLALRFVRTVAARGRAGAAPVAL